MDKREEEVRKALEEAFRNYQNRQKELDQAIQNCMVSRMSNLTIVGRVEICFDNVRQTLKIMENVLDEWIAIRVSKES